MIKSLKLSFIFCVVVLSVFFPSHASTEEAIPLITVKESAEKGEEQFVLNPDAITKIKQLSSPVKVIAAIGDARVGKSTALNFIHYTLRNGGTTEFHNEDTGEIFKTGNTMEAVTRGIWISIIHRTHKMDYDVILLDVEGTDLGDDTVTDKLSIFTALTSSTLMLFMKESPSTHILDFLYKIVRLSEKAFGAEKSDFFPRLIAVLRGALEAPEGYKSIDKYIIDALISAKWGDKSDEKRKAIAKRFPRERINVVNLPIVLPSNLLKSPKKFTLPDYFKSIEILTQCLLKLPEKKSLGGAGMDGQALESLIKKLIQVVNDATLWEELNTDFYSLIENSFCRNSYEKYIKPLLDVLRNTADDITSQKNTKMELFEPNIVF